MESKRPVILMGILLLLILAYVSRPLWGTGDLSQGQPTPAPPLAGSNTISGLRVHQVPTGGWMADFDYFYTGSPRQVGISAFLLGNGVPVQGPIGPTVMPPAARALSVQRGQHHLSLELQRPPTIPSMLTTTQVLVEMRGVDFMPGQQATTQQDKLASQLVDQTINWPDVETWLFERQVANKSVDQLLKESVTQIDTGQEWTLAAAKRTLERLVSRDPKFVAGYIELARIAMKTNWGPEGLHQAETLLTSALQIQPDSINAKILLGYVYAHQRRYNAAEQLLADAAKTPNTNLWLWSNWGEVLVMQGKIDAGMEKYREGLARPRTHDTYDRARLDAYSHLIALLEARKDLDGAEALYMKRADEFGPGSCFNSDFALFLLRQRGNPEQAMLAARKAIDGHCQLPRARDALGLAYYATWAKAPTDKQAELLNQAHVFLPIGPKAVYLLASSEHTVEALKKLTRAGESIDQRDNERVNALAYALKESDHPSAARLLRLGARPDALVGVEQMPVALLPVIVGDSEGIRLMRKSGVDYSELHYQGRSVLDQVRRSGNRDLVRAMDPKSGQL